MFPNTLFPVLGKVLCIDMRAPDALNCLGLSYFVDVQLTMRFSLSISATSSFHNFHDHLKLFQRNCLELAYRN